MMIGRLFNVKLILPLKRENTFLLYSMPKNVTDTLYIIDTIIYLTTVCKPVVLNQGAAHTRVSWNGPRGAVKYCFFLLFTGIPSKTCQNLASRTPPNFFSQKGGREPEKVEKHWCKPYYLVVWQWGKKCQKLSKMFKKITPKSEVSRHYLLLK